MMELVAEIGIWIHLFIEETSLFMSEEGIEQAEAEGRIYFDSGAELEI